MIRGFFILLAFQLVGEVAARGLALPAPGPVVGLALLIVALAVTRRWRPFDEEALAASDLGQAARGLLAALPLLFVPAGVGVVQYLGLVRGITVRSRSVLGNIGAGFQSLFGGNISIYTDLAEKAREEAYELMVQHAQQVGANAVIAMRYDANEITDGITEVLAYGTAVVVQEG